MIQIGFMSLVGCWKDFSSLPQVDIDEIPFASSDALTADAKIAILESSRECPDGEKAPTFVVYPPSEDPLPVAVIFHSNSAAFISNFDLSQGRIPDRLTASWTENKLWETLGMSQHPQDLYENSQGYLSIALSNAGFLQIYPGNCWGDYWHSDPERYPNAEHIALSTSQEDTSAPTYFGEFTRMGRTTAERTIQALNALKNDDTALLTEEGLIFSQPIDPTQQHWIGLGEGGRAILELLSQEDIQSNLPQSIIFDSSPLDLQPYLETPEAFPVESGTLNKVFVGEEGYPLSDLSLWSWQNVSFPSRVALIWSNGDSKMPQSAFQNAVSNLNVAEFWTEDINRSGHVFINSDLTLAQRAVQFMISGDPTIPEEPSEPAQEPSSETEDTGSAEPEDTGSAENEEAQE